MAHDAFGMTKIFYEIYFSQNSTRNLLQVNIADATDQQWVTCFQETAETLLGNFVFELMLRLTCNIYLFDYKLQGNPQTRSVD